MSSARRPWWRRTVRLIGWSTLFLAALAASVYFVMRAQVGPVSDAIGAAAEVSRGLGKAMPGLEISAIPEGELLAKRGW